MTAGLPRPADRAPRRRPPARRRSSFPDAARDALRDGQLRANLGHATTTIRAKRAAVVGEVPDWEQLREAGQAIKAATMARLDEHLIALEEQVTARGGTVHWARDADEANAIVTGLVRATGADEVVKVKSMATQEIGLNEALEAAGITALETDLAELIVQLGDDTPSHILVPAIHKNRAEIREIFLRDDARASTPGSPTSRAGWRWPPARTCASGSCAPRVAISGANFAVAETGTLAVVESEGNGRMCLTLPQTLITVMGIEKVVPTWRDLEVFLQLLPRSSTGERMNPYTSLWTGVTPGDGPQEFHLVLLDNGRTAVLADEVGREALHCIRCSACLNVCPVYERTGGHAYGSVYPGPIGAILSPQLTGVEDNASLPYASQPVRRLLRRLPGGDRHPLDPGAPARRARRGAGSARTAGGRGVPGAVEGHVEPAAVAAGAEGRRARPVPRPREADAAGRAAAAGVGVDPHPRPAHPAGGDVHAGSGPEEHGAMSARDEVLGRIRTALGDRRRRCRRSPATTAPPTTGRPATRAARLLVDRLEDYRATVLRCAPDDVARHGRRRARRAGSAPAGRRPTSSSPRACPADWRPDGSDRGRRPARRRAWPTSPPTVTGVAVAIAETGTLVLDGSPLSGRRALSLLPDCLVCVVDRRPGRRRRARGPRRGSTRPRR